MVTSLPWFPHPSAATKGVDRINTKSDVVISFIVFLQLVKGKVKRRVNQTSYKLSQQSYLQHPNDLTAQPSGLDAAAGSERNE